MARKKTLDKYPREYAEIFRTANERELTIACDSHSQAISLRNELYTYRSVLYKSDLAPEKINEAQNVRLSVKDNLLIAEPIIYRRQNHGN